MIVLDASATIEWLLGTTAGQHIENRIYSRNDTLHAPHLLDLEVTQVMRRLVNQRILGAHRADEAIQDLEALRINRHAHLVFLPRIWQLRHNFSAYDAAYIALAEQLGAALITTDRRLAASTGHAVAVEVF